MRELYQIEYDTNEESVCEQERESDGEHENENFNEDEDEDEDRMKMRAKMSYESCMHLKENGVANTVSCFIHTIGSVSIQYGRHLA